MTEDPNLIAILTPLDGGGKAATSFNLAANWQRFLAPIRGGKTPSSRDTTPGLDCPFDDSDSYKPRLQLTFSERPIDLGKGFCFGRDGRTCDVVLDVDNTLSRSHFYITFVYTAEGAVHLVLTDVSLHGTTVTYRGESKGNRKNFTWILDLIEGDVEVHVAGLCFRIDLATHESCQVEYDANVEKYMRESACCGHPPLLDGLALRSQTTTAQPSRPDSPTQLPILLKASKVGGGYFADVYQVINVSDGRVFARKEFHMNRARDMMNYIRREMRLLREYPHPNIVRFVDYQEEPPFLMTEYLPLGDLWAQNQMRRLERVETVRLLFQVLLALRHLHKHNIVHRDLKPENILVRSRSPLFIKLADFGLSSDDPKGVTFCGSELYVAPEMYEKTPHTTSVDIWSLGMIILEFAYRLPDSPNLSRRMVAEEHNRYCAKVLKLARNWRQQQLCRLLTDGMLQMKPQARLSAHDCLTRGYNENIFDAQTVANENDPERVTEQLDDDDDGTSTVVLSDLEKTCSRVYRPTVEDTVTLLADLMGYRRQEHYENHPAIRELSESLLQHETVELVVDAVLCHGPERRLPLPNMEQMKSIPALAEHFLCNLRAPSPSQWLAKTDEPDRE
ncbi:MAG: hypothetical protein M1828_007017 [Chrysothrix sp. TS-e1954]|nr:MAG: hypothetical protein M1828_007017 [Chrysothrix sp. TS-e1954]